MLKYCDMVVVGTTLKKDHYLFNPIDYDNAKGVHHSGEKLSL